MIEIRPLQISDCPEVAIAHAAYLRSPFKTWGGIHLLQTHYEAMTCQEGGICFVALVNAKFAGFVCGIWNRQIIAKINPGNPFRLAVYGLQHLLARPHLLRDHLHSFFLRYTDKITYPEGYELRPIVVLPQFRGQGVADRLVERLIQDARERDYNQIFLFTEDDNAAAIRFYLRFGFVLSETPGQSGKLFRYSINPAKAIHPGETPICAS